MTERDFDDEFREIMVHEAARDRFVRGTLEWIMLGKTSLVNDTFLDRVDDGELREQTGGYYALDAEDVNRAFDICEDNIVKDLHLGKQ